MPPNPVPATPPPAPPASPKVMMQSVMKKAFDLSDTFHHDARAFRNRLVVTIVFVIGVAVGLVLLQWRIANAAIFPIPHDSSGLSRWALMLLVMVFGGLGALVTTIPAMAAIPTSTSPFNFPLQQAYLKIVFGSLTAIVGVVVIGNTGVTNGFASLQALIGVGIVFGAGQQAVTQFLDKRAGQLIASKP